MLRPITGPGPRRTREMNTLTILIPIAWTAIAAFFVILCRAAARGDRALEPAVEHRPHPSVSGLVLWSEHTPAGARTRRPPAVLGRLRVDSSSSRGRAGRCIAG